MQQQQWEAAEEPPAPTAEQMRRRFRELLDWEPMGQKFMYNEETGMLQTTGGGGGQYGGGTRAVHVQRGDGYAAYHRWGRRGGDGTGAELACMWEGECMGLSWVEGGEREGPAIWAP